MKSSKSSKASKPSRSSKSSGPSINVRTIVSTLLLVICVVAGYMHFTGKVGPSQVVVITIDGARADTFWQVFDDEAGPRLKEAVSEGVKADSIATVEPPVAPTAHACLLSGADPSAVDEAQGDLQTLFTVVAQSTERPTVFVDSTGGELAGLTTGASVVHEDRDFRTESVDTGDRLAADLLVNELKKDRPALSFLVLPMTDVAGREYGPDSEEYRAALGGAMEQVERVLQVLDENETLSRTAVVVTSTHGMSADPDDPTVQANMEVPLIMTGPALQKDYTLQGEASITDVAPTLARLLGVDEPAQADGVVLSSALLRLRNRVWALVSGLSLIAFGLSDYLLGRRT